MEIGKVLKDSRLAKGYSLEQVEEATKIRAKYIEALENNEYDLLPGKVYVIAFMRNYARFLEINDEELVQQYKAKQSPQDVAQDVAQDVPAEEPIRPRKTREIRRKKKRDKSFRWSYIIAAAVIVLAIAIATNYPTQTPEPDTAHEPGVGQEEQQPDPIEPDFDTGFPGNMPDEGDVDEPQRVELILNVVDDRCWMNIEVDGQTEFSGIANAGEIKEFTGQQRISVELGNAGVVEVELNGENLGTLAPRNQVYRTEFTVQQG